MKKLLLVLAGALALAGGAQAGGWATVQLSSTPAGITAGNDWNVDVTVLQHGRTPLAGVKPTLTIRDEAGRATTFRGTLTGRTGVYRFHVTFPTAGTWTYAVYDGFEMYGGAKTHTYPPVEIAAPGGGAFPVWLVVGGILGAAALAAALGLTRFRRTRTAPALS
jgi:hypothetical protein